MNKYDPSADSTRVTPEARKQAQAVEVWKMMNAGQYGRWCRSHGWDIAQGMVLAEVEAQK